MSAKLVKVRDLTIGTAIWSNNVIAIVQEILSNGVRVSKITAENLNGWSISFSSPIYEDLQNRVYLATHKDVAEYLEKFNQDTQEAKRRFFENFPEL